MFRRLFPRNMPWNFRMFAALVITIAVGGYFLFTSGYPEEVFNKDEIVSKGMDFIAKPVIPMDLLKKIRQVLDRQS